jgi:Family of unknown function (DUF6090)
MIKFFRKIRQNMIKENKVSKYMLYAIGEIILVVIGILIALAVAEWNSNRRDIKTEHRLLSELKQGITKDVKSIKKKLVATNKSISDLKLLDSLLKKELPQPTEKLYHLFGNVYGIKVLKLNKAFYEDLKSVGFGVLKDNELRTQIINVFENDYNQIDDINDIEWNLNNVNRPTI